MSQCLPCLLQKLRFPCFICSCCSCWITMLILVMCLAAVFVSGRINFLLLDIFMYSLLIWLLACIRTKEVNVRLAMASVTAWCQGIERFQWSIETLWSNLFVSNIKWMMAINVDWVGFTPRCCAANQGQMTWAWKSFSKVCPRAHRTNKQWYLMVLECTCAYNFFRQAGQSWHMHRSDNRAFSYQ